MAGTSNRALGIAANVLVLLVTLGLLGVGWGYVRIATSLGEEGWAVHMPSEPTLDQVALDIETQLHLQFFLPPAEGEPLQTLRVDPTTPDFSGMTLPDSIRVQAERQIHVLAAYLDTASSNYKAVDRLTVIEDSNTSYTFLTKVRQEDGELVSVAVAAAPTEYVTGVLLPRAFHAFQTTTTAGQRFRRWQELDLPSPEDRGVTVRFKPKDSDLPTLVLQPLTRRSWDDVEVRKTLTEGGTHLGGLGWLSVSANAGSNLLTATIRIVSAVGLVLWVVVFVALLMMMARIRRLTTDTPAG